MAWEGNWYWRDATSSSQLREKSRQQRTMYNSLTKSTESYKPYDVCVITAANEYQARGYRAQLEWRRARGALPEETEFLVIADPQAKRIGSGGSTIYVLYKLLERSRHADSSTFQEKRILILHSGGDSKRLPAYSAIGKIFIPLPTSNGANGFVALFDILLKNLMELPSLDGGQMVLAAGDVLLSLDTSEVAFNDSGVTGLACPGTAEVASHHGVYVVAQNPSGENPREIVDFLQKPTHDELKKCNGFDAADRAFIDTGVMSFGVDAVEALMEASGVSLEDGKVVVEAGGLCERLANAEAQLDIYEEIPFAMLGKMGGSMDSLEILQQIPFSVCLLPYCEFFHVGASKHLIQNFHTVNYTASLHGFQNFSRTKTIDESGLENAFVYNSLIDTALTRVDGPSFVEGCHLEGEIHLGGDNILTGIPEGVGSIELSEGICVTCVPVNSASQSGWVSIIYGVEDTFKGSADDDGNTFLNEVFSNWMQDRGISATDLWADGEPHELWNARLFPFDPDPAESMQVALDLQKRNSSPVTRYPSLSLQKILQFVDYDRLLNNYSDLFRKVNVENLGAILTPKSDLSSQEILSWCKESGDYTRAANITLNLIRETDDLLFQARLYKLLSNILDAGYSWKDQHPSSAEYEDKTFELIREAVRKGIREHNNPLVVSAAIRSDEVVWVSAPARLDFAGGWTDTPPYCLEHGGSVLNAAVKLNGQYPIQVVGKLHPEPFIRINSIDLGERVIVSETSDMVSYNDPSNWSALPKAAFIAAGIIPENGDFDLQDILGRLGSGIDITLFSAVPAGSGLGTSSILGSAIIACLSRMLGQQVSQEDLFNRTLYMEQLMTTGGGWQDQIGGGVGGVKHIQTEPGLFQVPEISWTDLKVRPDMDLSERFLLYYTGHRRMAKKILSNIVGKYLDRDPVILNTIDQLREKSFEMKEDLDHRNISAFGAKIDEVWELNKTLDPGTTNEVIEAILGKVSHLIHGAKLLGAGGGGFLFMVAKGASEVRKAKQILTGEPPNARARFFDFDVDQNGLRVSVL